MQEVGVAPVTLNRTPPTAGRPTGRSARRPHCGDHARGELGPAAGFKAKAEREAARLRHETGLDPAAPIKVAQLAAHLEVKIISAETLVDVSRLEEIERLQSFAFSAATFDIRGRRIIVTNPVRTAERLASDVAHELAHLLLDHS